ncbi:MAG: hypothetical protein HY063_12100 [Bacteroidetes bacterium]|nr:hypothetical protein [Bacteroidota bacterium]
MNRLSKEGHIVEELNGVRCSIVEKNVSPERVEFLKNLLEHNGYTVMVAQTPPPPVKPPPKPPAPVIGPDGLAVAVAPPPPPPPPPPAPNTFTVGVTNISFHPMLAVYERSLFTSEGKIVSIAYWNQEPEKEEELYWQRRKK